MVGNLARTYPGPLVLWLFFWSACFLPKKRIKAMHVVLFAVLFQICLLVYHLLDYLLINHTFERSSFSGMLRHGFQGDVMRTFFLLSSICVSILGNRFLKVQT